MPDRERIGAENPDVDRCYAVLDQVGADVLAVLDRYAPVVGPYLCACALIQATGTVCSLVAQEMPERRGDIDLKLGQLRLHVATALGRAQ